MSSYITYREYFHHIFPDKDLDINDSCPHNYGLTKELCDPTSVSCEECWNRPYIKVGDKMRILDGKGIPNYAGGWNTTSMSPLIGKEFFVKSMSCRVNKRSYGVYLDGEASRWVWDLRGVKKIE